MFVNQHGNTITLLTILLTALILLFLMGGAGAVPPGKTVVWEATGGPGKVVFDGKLHLDKGLKCFNCHTRIFQMKKFSARMKMEDMAAGKFCGVCHNGARAFKVNDPANCARCHK